ncbi:MAG: 23S rRNA (guanosine2251-2'-O)-methyltransferase [Candidatus Paceibacteria bacterium]|jgi:23S rRNA (guanosine2251-2'-O)-methyltransferase
MKDKRLYLYGAHSVKDLLEMHPGIITRLYLRGTLEKHTLDSFRDLAKSAKVAVSVVSEKDIKRYVGDVNDQGAVALVSGFPYADFDEWIETVDMEKNPAVVIMDSLEDPHNVGAVIRTAMGLGASAVVIPSSRQVSVTQTVFKVAAGAANHIPIIQAGSLTKVMNRLKKKGFWIGALSKSDKRADSLLSHEFTSPTVFVVGSEGSGVRPSVISDSDYIVSIPIRKEIESYNASVSLAIALYEWKRQNS